MVRKKTAVAEVVEEEDLEEEGPYIRRRWFKYAGIKPERGRGKNKPTSEEVASLSNLEAESMDILWDLQRPASAMEVLEFSLYKRREQGEEPVSFPALQSTLRRLAEKGILLSQRDQYRTIRYSPVVRREEMTARILNNVSVKLLGKSLHTLLPVIASGYTAVDLSTLAEEDRVTITYLIESLKKPLVGHTS